MIAFYPEEVVRSLPHPNGSYTVYRVLDHEQSDFIECEKIGSHSDPDCLGKYNNFHTCRLLRDQLELYLFEGRKGTYRIGSKVKAFGLVGVHEVHRFVKNRPNGEVMAVISDESGQLTSRIAYFIEKI